MGESTQQYPISISPKTTRRRAMGNTASTPASGSNAPPSMPPDHPNLASAASPPPGCPMHKDESESSTNVLSDPLNPLNNIPALSQSRTSAQQQNILSLERTVSTIPRSRSNSDLTKAAGACPVVHDAASGKDNGNGKGKRKDTAAPRDAVAIATETAEAEGADNWVYPSPQQFYNALARKGKEAPEESIDMMVHIHNFLNERAWQEVARWEDKRSPNERIELARFEGRPSDLSPKARLHLFLGKVFPTAYNSTPPFDRHDWFIRRTQDGSFQRYVIDYYSCPDDDEGNPVFSLDVRPAVDSPGAVYERMTEWARLKKETWLKSASSGTTA